MRFLRKAHLWGIIALIGASFLVSIPSYSAERDKSFSLAKLMKELDWVEAYADTIYVHPSKRNRGAFCYQQLGTLNTDIRRMAKNGKTAIGSQKDTRWGRRLLQVLHNMNERSITFFNYCALREEKDLNRVPSAQDIREAVADISSLAAEAKKLGSKLQKTKTGNNLNTYEVFKH